LQQQSALVLLNVQVESCGQQVSLANSEHSICKLGRLYIAPTVKWRERLQVYISKKFEWFVGWQARAATWH